MKRTAQTITAVATALTVLLTQPGCRTVARENILSTINTSIGITLTENPQTQVPEAKIGFIRTQFYSVPTGKTVEGTNQSNAASSTPNVVSGIRASSSAKNLILGMDVAENFAVGEIAVKSPAATAMYIASAENPAAARAAANAVEGSTAKRAERATIATERSAITNCLQSLNAGALDRAGEKAFNAGLLDADDLTELKAKQTPDDKRKILAEAMDNEGTDHLAALRRFRKAINCP